MPLLRYVVTPERMALEQDVQLRNFASAQLLHGYQIRPRDSRDKSRQ
jgi:hypothetical protein